MNEKYCDNITQFTDAINNETPLIVLKSNIGTGKTYSVAQSINKIGLLEPVGGSSCPRFGLLLKN